MWTVERLISMGACAPQRNMFSEVFPAGCMGTPEDIVRAHWVGLDLEWALMAPIRAQVEALRAPVEAQVKALRAPVEAQVEALMAPVEAQVEALWASVRAQVEALWALGPLVDPAEPAAVAWARALGWSG